MESDSDCLMGNINENISEVINIEEGKENIDTGEQVIKSVINCIIDQCCNQNKDTLVEASEETVNSPGKLLVRRIRGDSSKWKKNIISKEKKKT